MRWILGAFAAFALLALGALSSGNVRSDRTQAASSRIPASLLLQMGADPLQQCRIARESCEINSRRCHAGHDYENRLQAQCVADREAEQDAAYRRCYDLELKTIQRPSVYKNPTRQAKVEWLQQRAERICAPHRNRSSVAKACPKQRDTCYSMGYCLQQYQRCTAFLPQPDSGSVQGEEPMPSDDLANSAPQRAPSPPPPPQGRYKVWIANRCDDPISVVYAFEDLSGRTIKRGWMFIKPNRAQRIGGETDEPYLAVHSTAGIAASRYRTGKQQVFTIVNSSFDAPAEKAITGRGKRSVPFEMVRWDSAETRPEIAIENCDGYRWGLPVAAAAKATPPAAGTALDDRLYIQTRDELWDLMAQSLAAGANPNARHSQSQAGWTPLFQSAKRWDSRGLAILLKAGADPQLRDNHGNTLVHVAMNPDGLPQRYDAAFFAALTAAYPDLEARNSAGLTPLDLRANYRATHPSDHVQHDAVLAHLVDAVQPAPDKRYAGGMTLLHIAAVSYDLPLATKLLQAGWPADLPDDEGKLAADYAREKSKAFHDLFLRRGAPLPAVREATAPAPVTVSPPAQRQDPAQAAERERERRRVLQESGISRAAE